MSLLGKALQPIAKKIGEEVAESVAKSSAPKSAAKAAEDWGWGGHKASDLPPSEYRRMKRNAVASDNRTSSNARVDDLKWNVVAPKISSKWIDDMTSVHRNTSDENVDTIMDSFSFLQKQGMPRAWTGKYTKAFTMSKFYDPKSYPEAVKAFRSLDTKDREKFLTLLPDLPLQGLVGTKEEILKVYKEVRALTPAQLETMRVLSKDWASSAEDLIATARVL
jgi:hypothetical protein